MGYAVARARARLRPAGPPPRVLVNSIPKAGTHLVTGLLAALPAMQSAGLHIYRRNYVPAGRDPFSAELDWLRLRHTLAGVKQGQYATGHLLAHPALTEILADLGFRVLFISRDPRDIVISQAHYVAGLKRHPLHRKFARLNGESERIAAAIVGFGPGESWPSLPSIGVRLELFKPWLKEPNTLAFRFEDLVGAAGGGDIEAQRQVVMQVAAHIDRALSLDQAEVICGRIWSTASVTFRSGRAGEWRETFDDSLHELFTRDVAASTLADYGYDAVA